MITDNPYVQIADTKLMLPGTSLATSDISENSAFISPFSPPISSLNQFSISTPTTVSSKVTPKRPAPCDFITQKKKQNMTKMIQWQSFH